MEIKRLEDENGRILLERVMVTSTLGEKMKGLLGRQGLDEQEGMFFDACRSVHTFFMKFEIDVLFCSRQMRVVEIFNRVRPWRMAVCSKFDGVSVLEMKGGRIEQLGIKTGDSLRICG